MSTLAEEVRQVQNPALGALLQWRLVVGYQGGRNDAALCPMPLLFLVLPILLHDETVAVLASTQQSSGLRAFAAKFANSQRSGADHLLAIHDRARELMGLSLTSLRLALGAQLVVLNATAATVGALTITAPRAGVPPSIRDLGKQSQKLGQWFAELTLHEIGVVLKVRV